MKTVTTKSGFTVELTEAMTNDMELVDALADLGAGKRGAITTVVSKVMGDKKKALYDHLRAPDGTVPIDKVTEEVMEILGAVAKNF